MRKDDYDNLVKIYAEREKAWRLQASSSSPMIFSSQYYAICALLVFTGFVCVMAWEVVKWVMG